MARNLGGRPKKKIDVEQLKKLAERQWNYAQIGAFFGVNETTIYRRFAGIIKERQDAGKAKLVDIMWDRIVNHKSERMLLHALNRYMGPVAKKLHIDHSGKIDSQVTELTDEQLKKEAEEWQRKENELGKNT